MGSVLLTIDDVVVTAESMLDVSTRSASGVHRILNLVNVEISMHGDSNIEIIKITLLQINVQVYKHLD